MALTKAGPRTFRVSRVTEVSLTDKPVVRPEGFDLEAMWGEVRDGFSRRFGLVTVRFRVEPGHEQSVARRLGSWIQLIPVEPGCYDAGFPHEASAAAELGASATASKFSRLKASGHGLQISAACLLERYVPDQARRQAEK